MPNKLLLFLQLHVPHIYDGCTHLVEYKFWFWQSPLVLFVYQIEVHPHSNFQHIQDFLLLQDDQNTFDIFESLDSDY